MDRPLRVAVIGSGPAGIYASDALMKKYNGDVAIDLFEKMPAPFGLIRYGVAPDHPRIKGIIKSLHKVMNKPELRLIGNVEYGKDITLSELQSLYDAVIFATGATGDRALNVPGEGADGSWGAGEFVGFYDGNPLFQRDWDLHAEIVGVVGVGNVAVDIARVLAKTADELHVTEIPDNVYEALKKNKATEVHMFGRRGPAQAKFTPMELKELDKSPTIQVIVDPEDIQYDEASEATRRSSKIQDMVCSILEQYAIREIEDRPHKLYIHFFESPVEILTDNGKVTGLRTERTELDGNGGIRGTGKYKDWELGAVYHAVGYRSDPAEEIPFDDKHHVIPNIAGRIVRGAGSEETLDGLYTTGWVKRGPVGLIGNTKGDANETVDCLLEDLDNGVLTEPETTDPDAVLGLLRDKGVEVTSWEGYHALEAYEHELGEKEDRERKKVVEWDDMVVHSRVSEK